MKVLINHLRTVGLRKVITIVLAAITFVFVPAFNQSVLLQAQAAQLNNTGEYNPVTPDTVKRIKEKAEDFSGSEESVAKTGLENIKQLGEKVPKTIELNARQAGSAYNPNESNKKEAMERDQQIVESK